MMNITYTESGSKVKGTGDGDEQLIVGYRRCGRVCRCGGCNNPDAVLLSCEDYFW